MATFMILSPAQPSENGELLYCTGRCTTQKDAQAEVDRRVAEMRVEQETSELALLEAGHDLEHRAHHAPPAYFVVGTVE